MHIYGIKNLQRTEAPRRARNAKVGDFSSVMESEDETSVASASDVTTINSISNILSLQEIDMSVEVRRQNAKHGESLLDSMDNLLDSTLKGDLESKQKALENLQREVEKTPKDLSNDALDELLDSIKLRSAVELAKNKLKG